MRLKNRLIGTGLAVLILAVILGTAVYNDSRSAIQTIESPGAVRDIAVSPGARYLAVVSGTAISVYTLSDRQKLTTIPFSLDPSANKRKIDPVSADFSPDGQYLAYSYRLVNRNPYRNSGAVDVVNTGDWQAVWSVREEFPYPKTAPPKVAFSPDGRYLTYLSQSQELSRVNFYEVSTWEPGIFFPDQFDIEVTDYAFSPDGKYFAVAWDKDNGDIGITIKEVRREGGENREDIWPVAKTVTTTDKFSLHGLSNLHFSDSGKHLAYSLRSKVVVRDTEQWQIQYTDVPKDEYERFHGAVDTIDFGGQLAYSTFYGGRSPGRVHITKPDDRPEAEVLSEHSKRIKAVKLLPEKNLLIYGEGGQPRSARKHLWNMLWPGRHNKVYIRTTE